MIKEGMNYTNSRSDLAVYINTIHETTDEHIRFRGTLFRKKPMNGETMIYETEDYTVPLSELEDWILYEE